MNSVSMAEAKPCERNLQEVKDKFIDLKSKTKKKVATILQSMTKIGGWRNENYGDWNKLMDSIDSLENHEKMMAKLVGREGILSITGTNSDSSTVTEEPMLEFLLDSEQLVVNDPLSLGPMVELKRCLVKVLDNRKVLTDFHCIEPTRTS